jgi:hypothetical protein
MHQSKNNQLSKVKKSNEIGYYPTLNYVINVAPSIGNLYVLRNVASLIEQIFIACSDNVAYENS